MSTIRKHQAWTGLALYENTDAARLAESYLRNRKFDARTYDDRLFRWFLFLRPPRPTLSVQVRRDHLKVAEHLLRTSAPELLQEAIRCPACDSLRVAYPQMTRKFILPTILLHLGIIFRVVDHECYCEHCQFTWNLPSEKDQPAPKPAEQY